MNVKREAITHDVHCADVVIHSLRAKGKVAGPMTPEPETVIEEIWSRATWVGPLMEGILHEPHCLTQMSFDY
jgi:hypothetical protein